LADALQEEIKADKLLVTLAAGSITGGMGQLQTEAIYRKKDGAEAPS
jgi:hypothetical protein